MTNTHAENLRVLKEQLALLRSNEAIDSAALEDRVITAFQRAARDVPFYRRYLSERGVDPRGVRSISDFRRVVPVIDKQVTFASANVEELCVDGTLEGVSSILTSSGHSGVFSYGVNTPQDIEDTKLITDLMLEYVFETDKKRTLLISALPMGVKLYAESVVLAETSVREDMVLAIVTKFGHKFDQIILAGEGSFLKKILEDGKRRGIDWRTKRVSLVTGEEGIAESWRSYVASLLGIDFENINLGTILSSMGVGELGLNLFIELRETVSIRRLAHRDGRLRRALFGSEGHICPMLFVYYPYRSYVEVLGDGRTGPLAVSMLNPELKVPLLRYTTGDVARILEREEVQEILQSCGYDDVPLPDLHLPFIAIYGRGKYVRVEGEQISPELVKEAMYEDFGVASCITGNFRLSSLDGKALSIHVQLQEGTESFDILRAALTSSLRKYLYVPFEINFVPHWDFPYGMSLDYERKFRYVGQ